MDFFLRMDFIGTATMTSRPPRATMRIRQASDARAVGVPPGRMRDCNWSLTGRCGYRNRRWLLSMHIFCCVIVTIHLSMTVVLRNAARENNLAKKAPRAASSAGCGKPQARRIENGVRVPLLGKGTLTLLSQLPHSPTLSTIKRFRIMNLNQSIAYSIQRMRSCFHIQSCLVSKR